MSFRGVPPTEALVATAAEQYRLIKREQPQLGECLVLIQARADGRRSLTLARVRLGEAGSAAVCEAEAKHSDPGVARARHTRSRAQP